MKKCKRPRKRPLDDDFVDRTLDCVKDNFTKSMVSGLSETTFSD